MNIKNYNSDLIWNIALKKQTALNYSESNQKI